MTLLQYGRIFSVISVIMVTVPNIGSGKLLRRHAICDKLGQDPSFDLTAVLGKPWRIQHAWNAHGNRCHELKFREPSHMLDKNVSYVTHGMNLITPQTPKSIQGYSSALGGQLTTRVYKESASLLDRHPNWTAPQLLVTLSRAPLEMLLLFADGTLASGKFEGIRHERRINVPAKPKRLRKFRLHMFSNGKYVIFANCDDEVVWLLGRGFQAPTMGELANITTKLAVGNAGKPVCAKKLKKG